ncbi:MAG: Trk system potassium transporter TrkA [Deltaproteobacteria bacterium]|nr:Trk system potassium transporter TrkA [Deltaproteobacteria bacterium]
MRALVIGTGEVGFAIIEALSSEGADVVAIDVNEHSLEAARNLFDIQTITGSGSNPVNLKNAGVSSADMVVAVTNSDEVNMVACKLASKEAPYAIRVARIRETAFLNDEFLTMENGFWITHPINPERVSAKRIFEIIKVPFAVDVATLWDDMSLIGLKIPKGSPAIGKTFADLRTMAPDLKMLVTTRIRDAISVVPGGDNDIKEGDTLYVVINPVDYQKMAKVFELPFKSAKKIIIAGGDGIGKTLATTMDKMSNVNVKLIEENEALAGELAESFARVLVLQGSATDENLLVEENIKDCDIFVAALKDEEANVMAALNAKRLGALKVMVLTSKPSYIPIIENSGIDVVLSPQALAIGTILQHIRKGSVKSVTPYSHSGKAEIIQFEALESAKAVGRPLKDVSIPKNAIVGMIVRNKKAMIPGGNDIIEPGDSVFMFAEKSAIPKLEKLMAVGFSFF